MIKNIQNKIPKKFRIPIIIVLLIVVAASISVPVSVSQFSKKRENVTSANKESAILDSARQEAYASAIQANQASATGFANVVVFVQFEDGNFVENQTEIIEKSWNDTSFPKSLKSYMNTISYGKFQVNNIFPGYDSTNNVYTAITVPYTDSEYLFVKSVIDQIHISSNVNLDFDGDECIDNLTIVVNHEAVSDSSDMYYDHKTFYDGIDTINGKYVSVYNLLNSSSCFGDSLNRYGVVCHEFMHSLGYPDLYRYDDANSNDPVGQWDLLASSSFFTTVPLAYMRNAFSNWTNVGEITDSTNGVIIDQALSPTGTQAYILRSPMSDTEFFVIECRKQGERYSDQLDVKIPGSGLIVYRIDTTVDRLSNAAGKNGVYVFREGVSSDIDCGRVIDHNSFFSEESGRTSFGSDKKDAGYAENALCFSNGKNSGIIIKNIGSISGETIYCDIEYVDFDKKAEETTDAEKESSSTGDSSKDQTTSGSTEETTGTTGETSTTDGSTSSGMTTVPDAEGTTEGSTTPPSTSSTYWSTYSGYTGANPSLGNANYVYQTVDWNGQAYALVCSYSNKLCIGQVSGGSVYNLTAIPGDFNNPAMAADSDGIYIVSGIETPKIYRYNGGLSEINAGIPSDYYAMYSIACANGSIYVAMRDCYTNFTGYEIVAYRVNKSGGSSQLSISASGDSTAMTSDGANVYLGVAGQNFGGTGMNVYALSGGGFYQLGGQIVSGNVNELDIKVYGGTVYAAVSSYSNGTTFVALYNDSWEKLGQDVSNSYADEIYLNIISGTPVITYSINGTFYSKSF